jgi:leucyl aminopeptidase
MPRVKIDFAAPALPKQGTLVLFVGDDLVLPQIGKAKWPAEFEAAVKKATAAEGFKGKPKSTLILSAPAGLDADRVILAGTGKIEDRAKVDPVMLGGAVKGALGKAKNATILFTGPKGFNETPEAAAGFAVGLRLRAYSFDRYKSKKDDDAPKGDLAVTIATNDPSAAKKVWAGESGVADGVELARDLVNEPPNVLYPAEFGRRAAELEKLGVEVEILDGKKLEKIGMRALLGVGQGSERDSRVAIMRWNGAKKGSKDKPIAFIGKGVCFDTGGISIKPAGGMEDMKGDMAGAACVVGLMHALAARKAKVDAIGVIGLVENMPDGNAQRPGDIVTSLSGQTIEIINTDAEGRLVLADVLWYTKDRFKPQFMIDLATLTGAIMVALGQDNAGMFSNNDELAERLTKAGQETGEHVWRMPLGKAYDKMIDSKFADMKNTGGRFGGAITAAQFLQRFVEDVPWVHLDIAGTAMGSPASDVNQSWSSGWGVRLLDRLVRDHYEVE